MSNWEEFYNRIRGTSWPDCASEDDFHLLPFSIQEECITAFGYKPNQFKKSSKIENKVFPIKTETACQLKWNWSTVYLAQGTTASCHRTNQHKFDTATFDFHNTPTKIADRERMLQGEWPAVGCEYCRNIELAGGQSDRITNLDFPGIHYPVELDSNPAATQVTPRILEVYFDNECNLKCLYCGPHFSSTWAAENRVHGDFVQGRVSLSAYNVKNPDMESNKAKIFDWLKTNRQHLTVFNILGGEPLYQKEFKQCLDFFEDHPAPELKLQIFTNLNVQHEYLKSIVAQVKTLIDGNKLREFEVTASLDCWGDPQEYVRYPLDLSVWEKNFEFLLHQDFINLIINSTLTPLTVGTFPDLLERVNEWSKIKKVYLYQNAVNTPAYLMIDIFGGIFDHVFSRAISLKPSITPEDIASRDYLGGIRKQSAHTGPRLLQIEDLFCFLNEIDRRRNTSWQKTFPWLIAEFEKYGFKC